MQRCNWSAVGDGEAVEGGVGAGQFGDDDGVVAGAQPGGGVDGDVGVALAVRLMIAKLIRTVLSPDGTPPPARPSRGGALDDAALAGGIALVPFSQGWTAPLGPRSRRIDCMIANVVVLV